MPTCRIDSPHLLQINKPSLEARTTDKRWSAASSIIGGTASRALYISSFYPRSNSCPSVRSEVDFVPRYTFPSPPPRSFDLIAPLFHSRTRFGAFGVWAGGTRVWNIPCSRHKYLALEICRPASGPRFTAAASTGYQRPALNLSPSATIAPKGFFQPSSSSLLCI